MNKIAPLVFSESILNETGSTNVVGGGDYDSKRES